MRKQDRTPGDPAPRNHVRVRDREAQSTEGVRAVRTGHYPWSTQLIRTGRPSVGNLMALCEENYRALMRLIPRLRQIRGELRSVLDGDLDLHLEILEQTPYTTLLRLTYFFPHDDGLVHRERSPDPDALLRVYYDAGQVEVLDLRQTALPVHNRYGSTALETKWKVNLFLKKWLDFCILRGHRFPAGPEGPNDSRAQEPAPTLA
jgi:uncharacterized protein YqiB (DUF1249 family)